MPSRQVTLSPVSLSVILRLKATNGRNHVRGDLTESPLRLVSVVAFILFIWTALYILFYEVFRFIHLRHLESIVAVPYVFHFFFIALMAMLAFSTSILCFTGLYGRGESQFLLTMPLRSWHVVATKYVESLVLSSWSLILLGLPLMLAMARVGDTPWYYYPLFVSLFLSFVAIPGAAGLLAAHAAALYFPRSARRFMVVAVVVILAVVAGFGINLYSRTTADSALWLKRFFEQLSAIRGPLWPSTWVTEGIVAAARRDPGQALYYLFITLANGLFFSWLAVLIVSRRVSDAFARAQCRSTRVIRAGGRITSVVASVFFFYLPRRMRWLAMKDLRTLVRDPLQWSQLAILFGLLTLYVVNIPRLSLDISSLKWQVLVAFLNLAAISLILATFTGRFVFPMVSLEGRQLWLLGPMPLSRTHLLISKFAFALTTTLLCAVGVTTLSMRMLSLPSPWWWVHLPAVVSVCIGLCGLAVGLGARLPMFGESNGARIASGMGGTVNLIASVLFVVTILLIVAMLSLRAASAGAMIFDGRAVLAIVLVMGLGLLIAGMSMKMGARYLREAEF
ncbi:MAG: hypothetical protein JXQ73_12400 [Phycisphaerae bacterium]|nr:hypothetical protein [Phycisphaerae bacterium]